MLTAAFFAVGTSVPTAVFFAALTEVFCAGLKAVALPRRAGATARLIARWYALHHRAGVRREIGTPTAGAMRCWYNRQVTAPSSSASPMSRHSTLSLDDDQTIVAAFDTSLEAELARGRLDVEGIASRIVDGNTVGVMPALAGAIGGVKLAIAVADLEAARAILFSAGTFSDPSDDDGSATLPAWPEPAPQAPLSADELADRAVRATFLGLAVVPPLGQLYALGVAVVLFPRRAELSPAARWRLRFAVAVDVFTVAAVGAIAWRLFG